MIATTESTVDENISTDEFEKFDGIDFSPADIKRMKAQMNIGEKKITKKYVTKEKRSSRSKMQKASRKKNRK